MAWYPAHKEAVATAGNGTKESLLHGSKPAHVKQVISVFIAISRYTGCIGHMMVAQGRCYSFLIHQGQPSES
jgi:hypothetical protein